MTGYVGSVLPTLGCLLLGAAGVLFVRRGNPRHADFRADIFRRSPIAMWVYDRDTLQFLDVNEAAVARYGYSREEFLRMRLTQIRPSEDVALFLGALAGLPLERETAVYRHLTKDGRVLHVAIRSHDVNYGNVPARLVYAVDVTSHTHAEERLQENERTFELAQRVAQLGTFVYDHRTGTAAWSEELYRLLGISPQESPPAKDSLWRLDHPEDAARVREEINRAKKEKREYDIDHRIVRPDGTVRHVQERGYWIFGEDGEPVRMIGTVLDITERKNAEASLAQLAYNDSLTNLLNRKGVVNRLSRLLVERRAAGLIPVFFLDLDRFKIINDTMGHGIGDQVLVEIARRLSRRLDNDEYLARTGGDEFLIVGRPMRDKSDITRRAAELLDVLSAPITIGDREHVLSASLGIGVYPHDGRDPDVLLRSADVAMYAAKARGGNNFHYYTTELHDAAARRFRLESALRRALEGGEFRMHFQPVVCCKSGGITGVEALVRWHDPDTGNVAPSEFIPFAEETGFIRHIGAWVLEQSFAQAKRWADENKPVRVWINISAAQLNEPALPHFVRMLLERYRLDGSLIGFELTESAFINNENGILETLHQLRALGIRIALDDFGVKYSSLEYLQRLPVDTVKIDRVFIDGIPTNRFNASIVRAVVSVAHDLGFKVTAEGVESPEELDLIKTLGCDSWQGFLLSPALPPESITPLLPSPAAV